MCVPFGTEHPIQNLRRKKLQPKRWYAGLELSVWKSGFRFCTGDKLRVQSSATRKVLPPIGSGRVARCVADDPDKFGAVQVYTTPRRTSGACSSRRCPRREVCASPRASERRRKSCNQSVGTQDSRLQLKKADVVGGLTADFYA